MAFSYNATFTKGKRTNKKRKFFLIFSSIFVGFVFVYYFIKGHWPIYHRTRNHNYHCEKTYYFFSDKNAFFGWSLNTYTKVKIWFIKFMGHEYEIQKDIQSDVLNSSDPLPSDYGSNYKNSEEVNYFDGK